MTSVRSSSFARRTCTRSGPFTGLRHKHLISDRECINKTVYKICTNKTCRPTYPPANKWTSVSLWLIIQHALPSSASRAAAEGQTRARFPFFFSLFSALRVNAHVGGQTTSMTNRQWGESPLNQTAVGRQTPLMPRSVSSASFLSSFLVCAAREQRAPRTEF